MSSPYKVEPWAHQRLAVVRARVLPHFALFFEVGTGKTAALIHMLLDKFKKDGRMLKTLILCPPIVIENWRREFQKHSDIDDREILLLKGRLSKRYLDFVSSAKHIVVTNYESILYQKLYKAILQREFHILVCDESHKLKNYKSIRSKRSWHISQGTKYRYLLTGTPITNSLEDLFGQYLVLDNGRTFSQSIRNFRNKYFIDENAGMPSHVYFPAWTPKPDSAIKIGNAIAATSMRVKKEECLDLPPLLKKRVDVELSAIQKNVYSKLEKDFVADLGEGYVAVDLAITKALRLQQIVTGFCPNEKNENITFRDNPRKNALSLVLESIDSRHSVLVWAVFRQNYIDCREVFKSLGISFGELTGETDKKNWQATIDAFQGGEIRAILGHPKAAGIGANLTRASYSVFYSRGFSLEDDIQAEGRNYRGGSEQHEKITRIDLVSPGTIDEIILEALRKKLNTSEIVLSHLKEKYGSTNKPDLNSARNPPLGI